MKLFYGACFVLAAVLVVTSCNAGNDTVSGNNRASTAVDSNFFNRKIEGEITVSAYDSMSYRNFLEEAARAFEALYPGTKVNVETFSAMPEIRTGEQGGNQMMLVQMQDDPQGRSDYISRINTNLMSGTGADLYAMDVLPLHKFAGNGPLENLDSYMEMDPGFYRDDYRENILDAIRYRNGTWFLPLDYDFNYFTYDAALVPMQIGSGLGTEKPINAEDLLKIGMDLYDGAYKLFNLYDYSRSPRSMYNMLLSENIQSYLNLETKKPNFIDGSFAAMLNSVRDYGEQGLIPQGVTGQQDAGQLRQRMGAPTDRFYFKQYNAVSLQSQFTRNLGRTMRMVEGGMAAGIDSDDEIAGIEANADGSVPFSFNQGFGINSRSRNKATAWAFLKFLLSKEMQLSVNTLNIALPLNNEARTEKAELTFAGLFRNGGGVLNDQQRQALEAYQATVERLSDNINCYVVQDTSLNDMINQEAQYFFGGSRGADEVARILQNKADLYLSE